MRRKLRFGRWCLPVLLALLAGLGAAGPDPAGAQTASAPQSPPSQVQLNRMLLLLTPDAAQKKSLDTLLAAQIAPGNPSYHQWLTAAQFAARYAVSAADAAHVAAWLQSQGFQVAPLPASRGWIEFSGTAAQVETVFGGKLEPVAGASGEARYALAETAKAETAKLPPAISGTVAGLVSLDGVLSTAAATAPVPVFVGQAGSGAEALAAQTSLAQTHALTPALAREWLQIPSNSSETVTGAGESIAILARSNVRTEDFAAFRKSFGLPEQTLEVALAGPDPGRTGDETAAIQAASWAGVAAPAAQIVLVPAASTNATDGIDLALAATVDGALAHTVVVGYAVCEHSLSAAHSAFYAALYRQAAAQGMAIVAATGDSGAAACHDAATAQPVTSGYAVNALASTPWDTAIGALSIAPDGKSLIGWRPAADSDPAYATGGGASSLYATPPWQTAAGLPASDPDTEAAHHRYLPDLSLPTAADGAVTRGLAFCYSGETAANGCRLAASGGSSAAAALFSGIAAQIAQKYGPQGNLAPNLYALALRSSTAAAFADVTAGNARMHCLAGSPDCDESEEIGFNAEPDYDLVSGLGSVHADLLLKDWAAPQATGTALAAVAVTNASGVTYNPSATITLSAQVIPYTGSILPTGTVQFYDQTVGTAIGTPVTLSLTGTCSYQAQGLFTDGVHKIVAQYNGDSVFAPATSPAVAITVLPSSTTLTLTASSASPAIGATITVTGTVTSENPGATPPTGTLTVTLDGVAQGTATLATAASATTGSVSVTISTGGPHSLQGVYSGDVNYLSATSPAVTVTASKVASVTAIAATPATLATGVLETLTATVAPATAVSGVTYTLTGSVTFLDGATQLGTVAVSGNTAVLAGVSLAATATHTLTAVYTGDATYSASTSSPLVLAATVLPVTVTLTESNTIIAPGQPVTLTATVTPVSAPPATAEQHPSGYLLFYANNGVSNTLISGQVPIVEGPGYSSVGSIIVPRLTAGVYVVTAQYFGDPTYAPAISNSLNLDAQDFSLSCSVNNIDMVQGTTQSVTCNVASLGGLTGPIQAACAEQNPSQIGAIVCTFSPNIVTTSGSTTLTVVTTAGNLSLNRQEHPPNGKHRGPPWAAAGGGVALAFAGLLLSPIGRRARVFRQNAARLMAMALLLGGLASAGLGCGASGIVTNNFGTPLGVHTLKITAGADVGTVTVTHNAYLTVNVTAPDSSN